MTAFWCPRCNTSWPDLKEFFSCPKDQTETRELSDDPDMTVGEAKRVLQAYLDFDKFLAERDRKARVA